MKEIACLAMILLLLFAVSPTIYVQSQSVEQFYNQNVSLPSWNMFPQGNYLQDYTQGFQNFRNTSSTGWLSNFGISSGWLNRMPIFVYSPTNPIVLKAGQSSTSTFRVLDPYGDRLYASSNIGTTKIHGNGYLSWSFPQIFRVYIQWIQ